MLINRKRMIAVTAAAAIALSTASFSTPANARSRDDAVAVATIMGVFGTIAAIAAADAARDRYHEPYYAPITAARSTTARLPMPAHPTQARIGATGAVTTGTTNNKNKTVSPTAFGAASGRRLFLPRCSSGVNRQHTRFGVCVRHG